MTQPSLTEEYIVEKTVEYLVNKENGNWHRELAEVAELHDHGADIIMRGGKRSSEYFIIEAKGKSYAKSAKSINKEDWINALGQLITRIVVEKSFQSGKTNYSYKYGLALPEVGARTALRRIPHEIAKALCLYIFSCDDDGVITMYTPKDFKKEK